MYKLGLKDTDLLTVNALRSAFSAAFSLALISSIEGLRWLDVLIYPTALYVSGYVIVMLAVGDYLYFAGIKRIGAARAVSLSYSYPLFLLPLSVLLLGESVSNRQIFGSFSVVLGICFISSSIRSNESVYNGRVLGLGALSSLGAALSWGAGMCLLKISLQYVSPLSLSAGRMVFLVPFVVILRMVAGDSSHPSAPPRNLAFLAAGGILGLGLGDLIMILGLSRSGAAYLAPFLATTPLFSALIAIALLGEKVNARFVPE